MKLAALLMLALLPIRLDAADINTEMTGPIAGPILWSDAPGSSRMITFTQNPDVDLGTSVVLKYYTPVTNPGFSYCGFGVSGSAISPYKDQYFSDYGYKIGYVYKSACPEHQRGGKGRHNSKPAARPARLQPLCVHNLPDMRLKMPKQTTYIRNDVCSRRYLAQIK